MTRLISYPTTVPADAVPQSVSTDSFEEATEFGVPRAIRPPSDVLKLGYTWKDWDISLRATWKFLRDATAEQVTAQVTRVLEADNKLTTGTVLRRMFGPCSCPQRLATHLLRTLVRGRHGASALSGQDLRWHAYALPD